jgi:UDP-N-acetyl-D-mannosaminuronic acid transferase (WecB/TagA/CpsF family)
MSLMAPKSCEEGAFQYCTYGYDKTKYSSYDQCIEEKTKQECNIVNKVITATENKISVARQTPKQEKYIDTNHSFHPTYFIAGIVVMFVVLVVLIKRRNKAKN